jgi:hypothetical protein
MALRREIKTQPKRSKAARYRLGPAKLYLDDVQLIYDTLFSTAQEWASDSADEEPIDIELKAGDALADEVSDLRDARTEEIKKVTISADGHLFSVIACLHSSVATIWAISVDSKGEELAAGIRDYINGRRSLSLAIRFSWIPYMFALMGGLMTCLFSAIASQNSRPRTGDLIFTWGDLLAAGIATPVLLTLAVVANVVLSYRYGAVRIVPRKENEVRVLGSETRKQLIIALISSLVLGLAGLWAGLYVHR